MCTSFSSFDASAMLRRYDFMTNPAWMDVLSGSLSWLDNVDTLLFFLYIVLGRAICSGWPIFVYDRLPGEELYTKQTYS